MEEDGYYGSESSEEGDLPSSSNAYARAFQKIMHSSVPAAGKDMGPVLAARKQLVAKKLEEEVTEHKKKLEKRKEHQELREKNHVLPSAFSDAKEKALTKLATRGVVTLFNAVSKAQKVQAGSESLKSRDAKAKAKQAKQAFISELRGERKISKTEDLEAMDEDEDEEKPGWSALQDDFMLRHPKLKDWDKQEDAGVDDDSD